MDGYRISEVNLRKNEYICFELFKVQFPNVSLKEETMKNTFNRDVAELAHCRNQAYAFSIKKF